MCRMSDMAHEGIPAITLGWRLKMALRHYDAQKMAADLGVSRATVSRWMADRGAPPKAAFIKQWALITRTDVGWLLTGTTKSPQPGVPDEGSSEVRRQGLEPRTRWLRAVSELRLVRPDVRCDLDHERLRELKPAV